MLQYTQNVLCRRLRMDEQNKPIWVDPPTGWMYGFPKLMENPKQDLKKWLLENGYPESMIKQFPNGIPVRCWEDESE